MKKIICSCVFSVAATAVTSYVIHKKIMKNQQVKHQVVLDAFKEKVNAKIREKNKQIDELTSKNSDLDKKYHDIINGFTNISMFDNAVIKAFNHALNLDMLADIACIEDEATRDKCLKEIETAISLINEENIHKGNNIYPTDAKTLDNKITAINKIADVMAQNIKDIINTYEPSDVDDDEDDDEDVTETETVSPKKFIINQIDGNQKVFETDPDIGFEVLSGWSDPEENEYCISAMNDAPLYNFLHTSIKEQLASHYVSKIDKTTFDRLMDEIQIIITFKFVNETDAEIIAVDAIIPFEIFKNNDTITITEGNLKHDNIIRYFRSNDASVGDNNEQEVVPESCGKKESVEENAKMVKAEKFVISNRDDDNIVFLVENIGANRDALKSFTGRLNKLKEINHEAWSAISDAFEDIISEVADLCYNDKLDDGSKTRLYNSLCALIHNMKKNYSSVIKSYSQSH